MRRHFDSAACRLRHAFHHGRAPFDPGDDAMSRDDRHGGFGVRRPLRFLAHKLDLNETQIVTLARILDDLKIERAQAEVDDRRSLSEFADAVSGDSFDEAKAKTGGDRRVQTAERLRNAVLKALREIHGVLNPDQRAKLDYLIRTGMLIA
jgi:Spy/CpxP family protein refolding chaperone